MKSDVQIQKEVMKRIRLEPRLVATEIGVAVKNGIVVLSGRLDSYIKKSAAESAAKNVSGVKAVAEDIKIGNAESIYKTDLEVAEAALQALKMHAAVPERKIKIKVENGIVRLEGQTELEYQRVNAKEAVRNLKGVNGVINLITVKPRKKVAKIH